MTGVVPDCFYRLSVKALIQDYQGRFLLIKEIYNGEDTWELPGGWLDHGENPKKWLQREIMEEMWLDVTWVADQPSYFLTWLENGKYKSNVIYRTTVDHLDYTPSKECQEIRFFSRDEAMKEKLFPNVEKFVEMYRL